VVHARPDDEAPARPGEGGRAVSSFEVRPDETALSDRSAGDSPRPLRRRVRGATLRTTVDAAAQYAARQPARPADAAAVRDALDEFEAAVERANRDSLTSDDDDRTGGSAPRPTTDPHDQNHLPEGAEQ
jgi:hypothetical protein